MVRALANGAEGPEFVTQLMAYGWSFSKILSIHPAVNGYSTLFREGEAKTTDAPPQLHLCWCKLALQQLLSLLPIFG